MSSPSRTGQQAPRTASWLIGDDGTTVHADARCRRLLGLGQADGLRGPTVWSVVAAEDHDLLLAAFRHPAAPHHGTDLPLRLRRRDGGLVRAAARVIAVLDDTGERQAWLLELTPVGPAGMTAGAA